jgi:ketosteroid isomerase-like protein
VVGLHRNVGERDGKQLDTMCWIVFEVESGQIKSGTEHFLDLHNWDQFWS